MVSDSFCWQTRDLKIGLLQKLGIFWPEALWFGIRVGIGEHTFQNISFVTCEALFVSEYNSQVNPGLPPRLVTTTAKILNKVASSSGYAALRQIALIVLFCAISLSRTSRVCPARCKSKFNTAWQPRRATYSKGTSWPRRPGSCASSSANRSQSLDGRSQRKGGDRKEKQPRVSIDIWIQEEKTARAFSNAFQAN